jgi:hypothetical protein
MNLNWFRAIALVVLLLATLVIKSKAAWLYINIASAVVAWVSTLLLGKAHEAFIRVSIDKSLLRYLFLESKGHQKARVFFAEIVNKKRKHINKYGKEPTFYALSIFKDTLSDWAVWFFPLFMLYAYFTTAHFRESSQLNTITLALRFFMIFIGLYLFAKYRFILKQDKQEAELIVFSPRNQSDSMYSEEDFLDDPDLEHLDLEKQVVVITSAQRAFDGVPTTGIEHKFANK